jgi:threonyl-tRNA synthetase
MSKDLKDHRQIGKELDLYSFHDVAPGAVFWHDKGYKIYRALVEFMRQTLLSQGYEEISTPVLLKSELFKKSGHWDFYKENMFNFQVEKESYSLKPMNCPEATLIYSAKVRSYNDLPLRLAEFGILHRNELSGVLGGLFRARQFVIDDAHHFVRADQILKEIHDLLIFTVDFYKKFGFETSFFLATRPEKAMGDPKLWKEAEADLERALKEAKVKYGIKEKDGAFYGPKIDIHIRDSQDRDWQLATIQLDFQIPERMELEYADSDGKSKRPVMVHRGILGSIERFFGILVEHYQGAFPLWLSPVQVSVLSVSDKNSGTAKKVYDELIKKNIRAEINTDNKTLGNKIREATLQKIPYMIIIGDKESEKSVSVRTREGKDLSKIDLYKFLESLQEKIEKFQ